MTYPNTYRPSTGPAGIITSAPRGGTVGYNTTAATTGYSGLGGYTATTYKRDEAGVWEGGRWGGNVYQGSGFVNTATPRVGRSSSSGVGGRGYRVAKTPTTTTTTTMYQGAGYGIRSTTPPSRYNRQSVGSSYLVRQPALRSNRVTLVLDLDETLVHSSFDPIPADLHIPLVMDGEHYVAYVNKRPHLEAFLSKCVELFDVIVWTASLSVYAEPLINELCRMARCGNIKKMYREHCTEVAGGGYVKDLSILGRSLNDVCILDNSPSVAIFQPQNLIPIVSWYEERSDSALLQMFPFLEKLAQSFSVQGTIASHTASTGGSYSVS